MRELERSNRRSRAGRFVCFLDHDDVYEPDCIERQLAHLSKQPDEVAAVYSDARIVNPDGQPLRPSFLRYHLGCEPIPRGPELFERLLILRLLNFR